MPGKQPQNWIKVCYTLHGASNVPARRTHAPAIANNDDAGVAGSIALHATRYDCAEGCGDAVEASQRVIACIA